MSSVLSVLSLVLVGVGIAANLAALSAEYRVVNDD
jgi:hypothetical protein